MREVAEELRAEVESAVPRLRALTESDVSRERQPGKWVSKEVLGHLVDSAANNHQRFVRARFVDPLIWPGYDQDAWVSVHAYRSRRWADVLDLWIALNRHVAFLIESVPADRLGTRCTVGDGDAATLEWLMRDYVRHVKHHLAQILSA
jgi:hypothetical protein